MPVYIPPRVGTSGGGSISITGSYTKEQADARFVHLNSNETINGNKSFVNNISAQNVTVLSSIPNEIATFDTNKNLVGSGILPSQIYEISASNATHTTVISDIISITGNIQSQVTNNLVLQLSTDSLLQQQINQIAGGVHLVFSEQLTGDGVSTQFQLLGNITNGEFISGGWNVSNVLNTLESNITDLNGKPIYDAGLLSLFTRHRIYVNSITGAGIVNLDYAPIDKQIFKIWYWYNVAQTDRIDNYYRDDFVAQMEKNDGDLATNIQVNTVNFNKILSLSDNTLQKSLETINNHEHDNYASVSDLSAYSTNSYVQEISSNLQSQINNITATKSFTDLIDVEPSYSGKAEFAVTVNSTETGLTYKKLRHIHNQLVANDVWTITHNLNIVGPLNVSIIDSGGTTIFGEIEFTNSNQLTIIFSSSLGGKAYIS